MFEKLRAPFKKIIAPIARFLVKLGLTADMITVIGAVGTSVIALLTALTGWLFPGALLITVLVIFDSLDGSVAAITTGGTPFGAFLDSTLDRIADWAILASIIIYFGLHGRVTMGKAADTITGLKVVSIVAIMASLYAIMTTFVTSYARARAQSVGHDVTIGIATRSDRLVIILVGMAIAGIAHQDWFLAIAIIVLDILGTITVLQRIAYVAKSMNAKTIFTRKRG